MMLRRVLQYLWRSDAVGCGGAILFVIALSFVWGPCNDWIGSGGRWRSLIVLLIVLLLWFGVNRWLRNEVEPA